MSFAIDAALVPAPRLRALARLRDFVELTKPRLSGLVVLTAWGGMVLAPRRPGAAREALVLALVAMAVGGANALNCWFERDTDGLMKRTRGRPLPSLRVAPRHALAFGTALAAVSVPALAFVANGLTSILALVAVVSYAGVYTPLKRRTPLALYVGAIPGAIPTLLGWTAATGRVQVPGLALFALLFVWQLPHFLAIAQYLKDDYSRAGIKALSIVHGDAAARRAIAAWSVALVPVSLALVPLGVAGPLYLVAAIFLGFFFAAKALATPAPGHDARWARGVMLGSVSYLALLFLALVIDAAV